MRFAQENVLNEMTWASSHFDLKVVFLGSNRMSNYLTTNTVLNQQPLVISAAC